MLDYQLPLFRPPSEADALILQVTVGCSHNRCAFCSMYRMKQFRVMPIDRVQADLDAVRCAGVCPRRVFLADGDAMCLSASKLCEILDRVNQAFPSLQRISAYANARDVLSKSPEQLALLRERKLRLVYLGLESGDDQTLADVHKGSTASQMIEAVQRAQSAGINASVMVLIGLAGQARSEIHAMASAQVINHMAPMYTSLLTYTPTPASELGEKTLRGDFTLPSPEQSLREIRTFVDQLQCRTYFTCNHASNYLALKGYLPSAKPSLLEAIDAALDGKLPLRPEWMRGL